ncbi:hypothetical protein RI367_005277 [Sorochytrium milnesiophthora]
MTPDEQKAEEEVGRVASDRAAVEEQFVKSADQAVATLKQRLLEDFRSASSELEKRQATAAAILHSAQADQLASTATQLLECQKRLSECEKLIESKHSTSERLADSFRAKVADCVNRVTI